MRFNKFNLFVTPFNLNICSKKRFYNRETIAASNYNIHQMSFPSMQLEYLTLF